MSRSPTKLDASGATTSDSSQYNSRSVILPSMMYCRSQAKLFSDLKMELYQIRIAEEQIPKASVTTPFRLFEFTRSSLGSRNTAQSFQWTMDHLFRVLLFTKSYLDIITSMDQAQHLRHLHRFCEIFHSAKLRFNAEKRTIGKKQVIYLEYIVSAEDGFK